MTPDPDGPPREHGRTIVVELADVCNLSCRHCVRDDDALHAAPGNYFDVALLRRVLCSARDDAAVTQVSFTGGEPSMHPKFRSVLEVVASLRMTANLVTNGWYFDRIFPAITELRSAVGVVSFSLDGATQAAHDRVRGDGSFVRVIQAVTRCRVAGVPYELKAGIRRDTVAHLQDFAMLGARLGARAVRFAHLLPTSQELEAEFGLSRLERQHAEQEISLLHDIFKMPVTMDVGYTNLDPAPPCGPLRGTTFNVDFAGRLTLCCNMSGYRGGSGPSDVIADLRTESFSSALKRLQLVADAQVARRAQALAAGDPIASSPCLSCLAQFGKLPWRQPVQLVRKSIGS